jgi:hypothetical protein
MDPRERLHQSNRYDMKLENGQLLTYRLPQMKELVAAGLIALPTMDLIAARLRAGGTQVEAEQIAEQSLEERLVSYGEDYEKQQRVVARMTIALDGESVTLAPSETLDIPQTNFNELVLIAIRAKPPGDDEGEA